MAIDAELRTRQPMTWTSRPTPVAGGFVTVVVEGTPVPSALLRLADHVAGRAAAGMTVILDLDGLVLTRSTAMRTFIAHLNERCKEAEVVLVCRRSTGRRLLRRWSAGSMPVVGDDPVGRRMMHVEALTAPSEVAER